MSFSLLGKNTTKIGIHIFRNRISRISSLSDAKLSEALQSLPSANSPFQWHQARSGKAIEKTYEFANFNQAWAFMCRTAEWVEKEDHHPEWFNVYNRVQVSLMTHDCDGISMKDIKLATAMDTFASELLPHHKAFQGNHDAKKQSNVEVHFSSSKEDV